MHELLENAQVGGILLRTLLAVARYANANGDCVAELDVIAHTAWLSRQCTLVNLRTLEVGGCLTLLDNRFTGARVAVRVHCFFRETADGPVSRPALLRSEPVWRRVR